MTARRTNPAVTALMASVPNWIELTMVAREEQRPVTSVEPNEMANGEDDGPSGSEDFEVATTTVEIVTKVNLQRGHIRYFFSRRDGQSGCEVHSTNGHVMIVQEPLETVKNLLPGFVEVHSSGAPSEVMVNPTNVRFYHGHYPRLGSTEAEPGTKLTFPNGHPFHVTESYEEVKALFGVN